jgi:hypothetical protein
VSVEFLALRKSVWKGREGYRLVRGCREGERDCVVVGKGGLQAYIAVLSYFSYVT